ncbi:MAG: DUF1365 domain-containing protein [Actinomycetota bacterium]|nr:DUF1365 domain-containing protein [Actinomycetota bacterium]
MTASGIYTGSVRHRRASPSREFRHRLALAYIDLAELPGLLGGRLTARRPGILRFRRQDYLGDASMPLDRAVRDFVQAQTGARPPGPVRVLTQLRSFGHCFNPVSFYYCFDAAGEHLDAVVAEVTSTPWGERHAYVVSAGARPSRVVSGEFDKELHVSPFMGMDHRYTCRAATPAQTLSVHIESHRAGAAAFDATLSLRRSELTAGSVRRMSLRYPAATLRVVALIYLEALGLRLAGVRPFRRPQPGGA